jgi:hypothetical protein
MEGATVTNYHVEITKFDQDDLLTTFTVVITPEYPVDIDDAKADIQEAVSGVLGDDVSVYVAPAVSSDGNSYREDAFEAIIVQGGGR